MNLFKQPHSHKCKTGPGGRHCPCCTKMPVNELKIFERRTTRRILKQKLHKEVPMLENTDI